MYITIKQRKESSLEEDLFGYKKERWTREKLLSLQLIQKGRLQVWELTFIAFADLLLEKGFDNFSWLIFILKNKEIKYKGRRIVSYL